MLILPSLHRLKQHVQIVRCDGRFFLTCIVAIKGVGDGFFLLFQLLDFFFHRTLGYQLISTWSYVGN